MIDVEAASQKRNFPSASVYILKKIAVRPFSYFKVE